MSKSIFVMARFIETDNGLYLEPVCDIEDSWILHEIENIGHDFWNMILCCCYGPDAMANFALCNGIAPYQIFVLEVFYPDLKLNYFGELIGDNGCGEIIWKMPIDNVHAARRWNRYINRNFASKVVEAQGEVSNAT